MYTVKHCICLYFSFSELWRKENTVQHGLSSLKEELAKSDQALRSMAGKVNYLEQFIIILIYVCIAQIIINLCRQF